MIRLSPEELVERRKQVVELAEDVGWKAHGKLRKKNGSSYQCFRRGNTYAWIGLRFIERSGSYAVVDFVLDGSVAITHILTT